MNGRKPTPCTAPRMVNLRRVLEVARAGEVGRGVATAPVPARPMQSGAVRSPSRARLPRPIFVEDSASVLSSFLDLETFEHHIGRVDCNYINAAALWANVGELMPVK